MASPKYFKSVNYIVSESISPGDKGIKVEWLFEELTREQIYKESKDKYAVRPGCGCTANVEVLEDRIVATYTDSTKKDSVLKSPNREMSIRKTISVFLDDGKDLIVKNERGVDALNVKDKENITLTFTVIVQV